MSYEPRPGTVAFRALAYLETLPQGAEATTSQITEALGLAPTQLQACLEPPLANGRIFRRQRDDHPRSPWWWSLTDFSALPKAPRPAAVAFEVPEPTPETIPQPKKRQPRIEEGPVTKDEHGFRACLWTNGVLQIEREPGDLVLIAPPHVEQIRKLLTGGAA
jgi:hypothetical protein